MSGERRTPSAELVWSVAPIAIGNRGTGTLRMRRDDASRDGSWRRARWRGRRRGPWSHLLQGLRIATLIISAVVAVGLGGSHLVRHLDVYEFRLVQVASCAMLCGVLVVEALLLARRRPWGRVRAPTVALVLLASLAAAVTLPQGKTSTTVDRVFGAANFVGLVVLLDRPLWSVWVVPACPELIALANLLLLHDVTRAAPATSPYPNDATNVVPGYGWCPAADDVLARGESSGRAA